MSRRAATYYEALNILPSAEAEQIKRAYWQTMQEIHPDHASDEEDRLVRETMARAANEAWETLRDPARRTEYDASLGLGGGGLWRFRFRFGLRALVRPRFDAPLRMPRPSLDFGRPQEWLAGLAHFTWQTRLGQWLLLLGSAGLLFFLAPGGPARGPLTGGLLLALGLLLARGGEPTPISDALRLSRGILVRLGRLAHLLLIKGGRALLALLAERAAEARHTEPLETPEETEIPFDLPVEGSSLRRRSPNRRGR